MREIKFRAHQKGEIGNKSFKYFTLEEIVKQIGYEYGIPDNIPNDIGWIFDQYTGLKDKNGKEIYEGDLLNNHDNEIRVCEYSNGSYWLVGRKEDGTVIVDMFEPFILNDENISAESQEIIGNIYENPELMKEESKNV